MNLSEKTINKIAWWIPYKHLRNAFKNYAKENFKSYTLDNLVLITGQKCNLKCRNCANFSPYLSDLIPFYKYEDIKNDLDIITKKITINRLQIQGGNFLYIPILRK